MTKKCKHCNQKFKPRPGDVWVDDDGATILISEDGTAKTLDPWGAIWGLSPRYTNPTKLVHRPSRKGLEGPRNVA